MPRRTFTLDVREFVAFAHRSGNLGGDGHFQASNRALEGTRGHQRLQKSRGETYVSEVAVEFEVEREGVILKIRGRLDGMMPLDPVLIEEIKTVDSRWNGLADPVHFAQLRTYAAILAGQKEWPAAQLQLTYLDYETDETTLFREQLDRPTLDAFLQATLDEWFSWLLPYAEHLEQRDSFVATLAFPFPTPRAGQLGLSRSVYKTIRDQGNLFLEAPTGLGKTMGALFPAVKALPLLDEGKIFYVTAKTPARLVAEEAVRRLQETGARIRAVNLTAKGKICFTENPAGCDMRTCPYALGYHDRIKPALRELLQQPLINRIAVEEVAKQHMVCPFELSLDATTWSDVIIGDFNYVFDPSVRLQRHFAEGTPRHVVLVDEAHNLVDRSREMYSATISVHDLKLAPGALLSGKGNSTAKHALQQAAEALSTWLETMKADESVLPRRETHGGARALSSKPETLLPVLRKATEKIEAFLAKQEPGADLSAWMEPYFSIQSFLRTAEGFGPGYFSICDKTQGSIKLFCGDPRERLLETLEGLRSAVFFSATLSPLEYFCDLLGGDKDDSCLRFASPFSTKQMQLKVAVHDVSFKGRVASMDKVVQDIQEHLTRNPGNHLIFCPSRDYLLKLETELRSQGLETLSQASVMDESEREAFLSRFIPGAKILGLAVMGGIFSEGVDLPGDELVGVTVIGVGLPKLSLERDLLQKYFEETRGFGYDYAYRFPGMQRVIQAVGRLIRSEEDQGHALLIDQRYHETRYRNLFPKWWEPKEV